MWRSGLIEKIAARAPAPTSQSRVRAAAYLREIQAGMLAVLREHNRRQAFPARALTRWDILDTPRRSSRLSMLTPIDFTPASSRKPPKPASLAEDLKRYIRKLKGDAQKVRRVAVERISHEAQGIRHDGARAKALGFWITFVAFALMLFITSTRRACGDCAGAIVDCADAIVIDSAAGAAVSYYDTIYLLKDSSAAEQFIADPESSLSVAIKARTLWLNPIYWSAVSDVIPCPICTRRSDRY